MPTTPNNMDNFWQEHVLPQAPQAAYFSAAPFGSRVTAENPFGRATFGKTGQVTPGASGFSPAAQRYWTGQYGNVMNQFMGEAGRRMRSGQDPTSLSFMDFLEEYPWTQRYTSLSPRLRSGSTTRFNPATRYMY